MANKYIKNQIRGKQVGGLPETPFVQRFLQGAKMEEG